MHIKNIKIISSFIITGRGRAFQTNLDFDVNRDKFNKGDTFRYQDKVYEINSVEAMLIMSDDKSRRDVVAFIAKEITPKEMFIKTFKPEHDPTFLKEVEWRIRNRWWLRHWQRIQIRYYIAKDKIKSFFKND